MKIADRDFEFVRKLLFDACKIALQPDQRHLVESRLEPIARKAGLSELRVLVDRLRDRPMGELRAQVIDALTTNETSFFRDVHPFEVLRTTIIPELIAKRRPQRALRLWSAGCSTGQEPFSLAILLLESFPELARWDVRILASDVSGSVLAKAKGGCFSALEIGRGLAPHLVNRYFDAVAGEYRAKPALHERIDWLQLNLSKPFPRMPLFDVVFLRNVLIYFPVEVQEQVLAKVHAVMRRDGSLFLGTVESMLGLSANFEPVVCGKTTLYRPIEAR